MSLAAWPQYTMIALLVAGLVAGLLSDCAKDRKSDRVSGVFISLGVAAFQAWVLWAGGFWWQLSH